MSKVRERESGTTSSCSRVHPASGGEVLRVAAVEYT